jgi:phosphatidate cytidylyltransferase
VLWTRVASAVVLGPLFLLLVYLETPYFNVMIAGIAVAIALEFARMDGRIGRKRQVLVTLGILASLLAISLGAGVPALLIVLAVTIALVAADQVAGRKGFFIVQIAVVYVAIPAISLLYVMAVGGAVAIFWLLAVVWATDIGAYAFGRIIGGPKLAPSISPNKTWSGAVGGFVSAALISTAVAWGFGVHIGAGLVALSGILSIVSQAGDLFESGLKRRYNVKDSGSLIPGHGGFMDRFDGLWFAAPVAALATLLGAGIQP